MPSASKSKVYFFFEKPATIQNRTALKGFIESIFKKENQSLKELRYIFCSDKSILGINKQFLNHDFYTDIITFSFSKKAEPTEGEIYISIDRVKENAAFLKETFSKELTRVIFHGALHLCGYKDKNSKEKWTMRNKEDFYIEKYFRKNNV